MDVGGMASADDGLGQRFVVVDRVELAFEVLFEQIRVVYALDRPPQNDGFLFGEMYELRNLPEMRRLLVEADAVARFLDDEARCAEGVDIAVDRAPRHGEPLGEVVHRVGGIGREHLHQTQQSFEFGLVHAVECAFRAAVRQPADSVQRYEFICFCRAEALVPKRANKPGAQTVSFAYYRV